MKKTLFLSAILGAALCSNAFAETKEYTGNSNSGMQVGGYGASDEIIFAMTPGGSSNWFDGTQSTAAAILIKDDASTTTAVEGLHINNGNGGNVITFSGAVSGNGAITKKGRGQNLVVAFTGDVTDYTGNITLDSEYAFTLRFGGSTIAAVTTSATEGVAGTGSITFANNGNSTLEFNYTSSANPVYITNAIDKSGNATSKVKFLGGASYVLTKNAAIDELTINNGSTLTVGADSTLALKSDSTWTKVGEETPRTSGNGFGAITYTKNFGTSLVNNGTITVNGGEATMTDGVVTGTGNSTTYYVNEGVNISSLPGATALVVNSTSGGVNQLGMSNTTYGNLDITINGGRVITARDNGTAFTKGDVVVNGGGTLAVVESGHDALGWGDGKTKSITLRGTDEDSLATFEMSYTADKTLTMETALNLNGHSRVSGTRKFNTYGGVITATGTDNIISSGVELRKAASFVVNADSTLEISGAVVYGQDNDRSMTKTGAGVLTISGNISGTDASKKVSITGDGANTIISSASISNATLTNVKLAKGSAQTITGTVTLDNATLTNQLDVKSGGTLTLTGGVTDNGTSQFGIIVGTTGHTGTLIFESGTYDMSGHDHGIAVFTGSTMTLNSGATLTLTDIGFASAENQRGNNGTVTVNSGATLNITGSTVWNTYVGTMTANGTVTVADDLYTNAQLAVGGTYTQTAGTATVKTFTDIADNATLTLGNGNLIVQATTGDHGVWFHTGSEIKLTGTGTLTADGMVISKVTDKESSIKSTSSVAQIGSNNDAYNANLTFTNTNVKVTGDVLRSYTISGGSVTVNSGTETNIKSALSATTDLTVNEGSTANFTNKDGSSVASLSGAGSVIVAENADLTVAANKATIGGMTLANGATVTVNEHKGTLALQKLTVTGEDAKATINANLDLSGATVTLNGNSVTMGCELKFDGTIITLSDDDIAVISNTEGAGLLIFSDVESLTLGNVTYTTDYIGLVEDSGLILTLAQGATSALPENVFVNFNATDKTVSLSVVPEPATATLSLLALAALAARRKRK